MKKSLVALVIAMGMFASVPVYAEDTTEAEKPLEAINKIGDMVSTDTIEFTLKAFQFGYKLSLESDDTFHLPTDANKGLAAGDGKVYVIFDFDVTNLAKETISGTDVCGMDSKYNKSDLYQIDYKDGYIFDNGDYAALNLASISGNYNYNPVIEPLETIILTSRFFYHSIILMRILLQKRYDFCKSLFAVRERRQQFLVVSFLPLRKELFKDINSPIILRLCNSNICLCLFYLFIQSDHSSCHASSSASLCTPLY